VRTRAGSTELADELDRRGFPAEVLNGDLTQETRERVLNRFRQNQIKVLVATDVAARGLDIDDISHVFNFDLPEDEEIYVHRIGRTGRAGKTGIAISLVSPAEKGRLHKIEAFVRQKITLCVLPTEEDILNHRDALLLTQVNVWLQRARYRRERELVAKLVEEGNDPLEIAAAALKLARAEEKQRPIAPLSEAQDLPIRNPGPETKRGYRRTRSNQANVSHEVGMIRLTLSKGRVHGIRPNDVVSSIAYYADIPGGVIGKIHIEEAHTLIDVPETLVSQVLAKTGNYRINRQPVTVELA
jgi:ATP-dependent RNA helicase DeaD